MLIPGDESAHTSDLGELQSAVPFALHVSIKEVKAEIRYELLELIGATCLPCFLFLLTVKFV